MRSLEDMRVRVLVPTAGLVAADDVRVKGVGGEDERPRSLMFAEAVQWVSEWERLPKKMCRMRAPAVKPTALVLNECLSSAAAAAAASLWQSEPLKLMRLQCGRALTRPPAVGGRCKPNRRCPDFLQGCAHLT